MTSSRSFSAAYEHAREQARRRRLWEERLRRIDPDAVRVWRDWTSVMIATGPADGVGRALSLRGWRWAFGSFWLIGHSAGAVATGTHHMAVAWLLVALGVAVAGARSFARRHHAAAERLAGLDGAPGLPVVGWWPVLTRTLVPLGATTAACWAVAALGLPWSNQLLLPAYLGMHLWASRSLPSTRGLVYLCRAGEQPDGWFLGVDPRRTSNGRRITEVRRLRSDEQLTPGPWCLDMRWPAVERLTGIARSTPDLIVPLPVGWLRDASGPVGADHDAQTRAVGPGDHRWGPGGGWTGPDAAHEPAPSSLPADALLVLGLAPDATVSEARRAHRRLAKEHHPDRGGDPRRFREIQDAWEAVERTIERGSTTS